MSDQHFKQWQVSFTITSYTFWTIDAVRLWVGKLLTDRELTTLKIQELPDRLPDDFVDPVAAYIERHTKTEG